MGKTPSYTCTSCGREVGKFNLKTKRVEFREVGKGGAMIKSRTVGWLCIIPQEDGSPSCLDQDSDWHRPVFATSPGMAGSVLDDENSSPHEEEEEPLFPPPSEIKVLTERLNRLGHFQ